MTEETPLERARTRYPALMAYIENRSAIANWTSQLRIDQREALAGGLADVAAQMRQAQADYGSYPYNSAMGRFLGLPLGAAHEPAHGYYMANGVMNYHTLGEAQREAERLIAEGKTLRVVAAKSKKDGKPVRFHTFAGPDQIRIGEGGATVAISNGKVKGTLSSNWSVETTLVKLAAALRTGAAYGQAASPAPTT